MLNTDILKHSLNFCLLFHCEKEDFRNMGFEVRYFGLYASWDYNYFFISLRVH